MAHNLSPAVERARDAARASAERAGATGVRLADWVFGLLADDEAKPALLLRRIGVEPAAIRAAMTGTGAWVGRMAPPEHALYAAGREKAISLQGDPTLTTEFVLLAVLESDTLFREALAASGVVVPALESLLRPVAESSECEPGPTFEITEPLELVDAARVVDANLNRAREALRVLDDYCRFVLSDRVLTQQLKDLRHQLAAAAAVLPQQTLLAGRDTVGDVGTDVSSGGEYERRSPAAVASVNLKRLQEALRSIEEYAKIFDPELGRKVEHVRYVTYTLERAVMMRDAARGRLASVKLYVLLTGSHCTAALDWTVAEAAAGGAAAFQLREKELPDRELLQRARQVRRWTRDAGVLFIVNDRPDIARVIDADGVHLGQDDLTVSAARRVVGPDAVIGVSTHTPEQVRRAILDGADYLGVGPTFPSSTKVFDHYPGLEFVRYVANETSLPFFVIGGVVRENVARVVEAGGSRVAVSAAIASSDEPRDAAAQLVAALSSHPVWIGRSAKSGFRGSC